MSKLIQTYVNHKYTCERENEQKHSIAFLGPFETTNLRLTKIRCRTYVNHKYTCNCILVIKKHAGIPFNNS